MNINVDTPLDSLKEVLQLEAIQSKMIEPLFQQWGLLVGFLPKVVAAVIVLLIGVIIGLIVAKLTAGVFKRLGIDKLSRSSGVDAMMTEGGLTSKPSRLIGKMMFWLIVFTAFIPAADLLGIHELVELTQKFVLFLPKIIAAVIIVVFGFVVANFLRQSMIGGQSRLGLTSTKSIGGVVYGLTIAVTTVAALGQLELDTRLLYTVLITIIASMSAAIALAVGLGARSLAHNLIAGFYARETFQPGQQISLDDFSGKLLEIRAQNTLVQLDNDELISIPNSFLFENLVRSKPG